MIIGSLSQVLQEAGGVWRHEGATYRYKLIMGLDCPLLSVHRRGSKPGDVLLCGVDVLLRDPSGAPVLYVRTGLGVFPVTVPERGWTLGEQGEG
jgi:hypothetical protein